MHGENKICKLLQTQSAVTTAALAKKFNVSIETIRKDLLSLEKNNGAGAGALAARC